MTDIELSLEEWLKTTKALEPITESAKREIAYVQAQDPSLYTEDDVRAEIIEPIVRALGYRKMSDAFAQRQRALAVGRNKKFVDFSFKIWEEDFWLLEAKRVQRERRSYSAKELEQALLYATHPEINAALLVLCDGRTIQVFDRERDLSKPVLDIDIKSLNQEFDRLRTLLAPMQAWFFQKRRVLRLVDKVLDKEVSMQRLEDMRRMLNVRLDKKKPDIAQRQRDYVARNPLDLEKVYAAAELADLVDVHMMTAESNMHVEAVTTELVRRAVEGRPFDVLYATFPDLPKCAHSGYWANALLFLMKLSEKHAETNWLPAWLNARGEGGKSDIDAAVRRLLTHCLSCFETSEPHRLTHLYSVGARRVAKQIIVAIPAVLHSGTQAHALTMHLLSEATLAQIYSCPQAHNVALLERCQLELVTSWLRNCTDERGRFVTVKAKQELRDLWQWERRLLGDGRKYREAAAARNLGEMHPTMSDGVRFDWLAHAALCFVARFPRWRSYVLEVHRESLRAVAQMGSFAARDLLGEDLTSKQHVDDETLAQRFFLGDAAFLRALTEGYGP